jgi:cysteinyl-tRNA synthetase, unknown class
MFEQPLFWVLIAIVTALAYLLGSKRSGVGSGAPAGTSVPAGNAAPKDRAAPVRKPASATSGVMQLADVRSWGYQLQDLDLGRAAASPFDLLVIDYSKDGSEEARLTPAEIERLKRKPDGGRRIVLAYVSVGEAESYRPYWDASWKRDKPHWLLRESRDWPENYSVCFWDPGWQRLICGSADAYLDRVQAQGFDGVYLDKCDVFEDLQAHEKKIAASRPEIERDMVSFVQAISRHLKARDPSFIVVMQNAEVLLNHPDLVAAIDGVAKEELIYGVDGPEKKNGDDEIAWSKGCLDRARAAGKPVLVVEYLNGRDKIAKAAQAIEGFGYVLYIAPKDRQLKRLNYDVLEA